MAAKYQLIKTRGLAGMFFWAENYLPHNYPFWRLIDQEFKQTPPVNHAPQVSIVPHAPVNPGESVTLKGGTSDSDGDGLILQWALQSGPPGPPLVYAAANEESLVTVVPTPGNYAFTLTATDGIATTTASAVLIVGDPLSVDAAPPVAFALGPPRPSPSAGPVALEFAVPRAAQVRLRVMDVQGRAVRTLAAGPYEAGRHVVTWDGLSSQGRARAGLYFVWLQTPERSFVQRLVIAP
jgi:FlgD Ig-like domain/PKD domain